MRRVCIFYQADIARYIGTGQRYIPWDPVVGSNDIAQSQTDDQDLGMEIKVYCPLFFNLFHKQLNSSIQSILRNKNRKCKHVIDMNWLLIKFVCWDDDSTDFFFVLANKTPCLCRVSQETLCHVSLEKGFMALI